MLSSTDPVGKSIYKPNEKEYQDVIESTLSASGAVFGLMYRNPAPAIRGVPPSNSSMRSH